MTDKPHPPDVDFTPLAAEQHINELANRITKGVRVRGDAYEAYRLAATDYDEAFAFARDNADGPQLGRKYKAVLETMKERRAMEIAEIAWRRTEFLAKALELELMGTQSISKSVLATYGAAGRGER